MRPSQTNIKVMEQKNGQSSACKLWYKMNVKFEHKLSSVKLLLREMKTVKDRNCREYFV